MKLAAVLSPWVWVDVEGGRNRPQVAEDYAIGDWTDITHQPGENLQPDPNLVAVEIVCEDAVLAAIDADPTYLVLWDEDVPDA